MPLRTHGYQVVGSDLSERAVARAATEARAHDIWLPLLVADVREVADAVDRRFDAVISFDNALLRLVTDDDLLRALRSIRRPLTPGGRLPGEHTRLRRWQSSTSLAGSSPSHGRKAATGHVRAASVRACRTCSTGGRPAGAASASRLPLRPRPRDRASS
ncbi:class I SAM-dependent methyltransferase [Streptomyces sp. NPDC046985]|uniref:class I SAM-dependent methyltransferase n=1 Tax=Streptomyces sp. NPDC046985 TaxID=3155377 RepID=UPI0033C663A3